jgi:hypothetical protein
MPASNIGSLAHVATDDNKLHMLAAGSGRHRAFLLTVRQPHDLLLPPTSLQPLQLRLFMALRFGAWQ